MAWMAEAGPLDGVARREYVGAGGFEGDGGGFDGAAGRDGHVLREGIEIGGLPDGEDHGIGGDGAGLRFIKGRAERAGSVLDGKAGFDGEAGNGARAFDAHRAPAALEVDALVAGVGDVVRIGGQFGFPTQGKPCSRTPRRGAWRKSPRRRRRRRRPRPRRGPKTPGRDRRARRAGTPRPTARRAAPRLQWRVLRLRLVPGARRNAL